MQPSGRSGLLFDAFCRITSRAFRDDMLLSCPTLSKAPNYGQVLRRFIRQAPATRFGFVRLLKTALRYCGTNLAHILFLALSAIYVRLLGWKLPEKELLRRDSRLVIIDTFAVLPKIAQDGAFNELYLKGLAEEATEYGHDVLHLYRLYGSRNPKLLWNAFGVLARQERKGLTEAHLLRASDWLRLLRHFFCYPLALFRLIRSLRSYPPGSPESYIREALISTAGQCVMLGEARRLCGYRLGLLLAGRPFVRPAGNASVHSANHSPGHLPPLPGDQSTLLVSWYENQTVNKCLFRGLAQAEKRSGRHIPSLGAQLFLWPSALLNNHPDDGEAALGLAPDRVLVNGPYFLPEKTSQQYAVGPSLRYGDLFREAARQTRAESKTANATTGIIQAGGSGLETPSPSEDRNPGGEPSSIPLLALLSYHPDEVRRVLQMLLPLAEAGADITYKFHPATRPEHYAPWLPVSPQFAQGALQTALQSIRYKKGAVLGSGSGSLAEAAALGIPVLAVQDPVPGLSLNYLPEFGQGRLWEAVESAEQVQVALQELGTALARPDRGQMLRQFRDLLFTEPTKERIREDFLLSD